MIQGSNSLTSQLEQLNILQQNAVKISNAFLDAVTSSKESVPVVIQNFDGTTSTIVIPTNSYIYAELTRMRQSLLNLSGLTTDKFNALVSIDDTSSFREVFVNNFKRSFDKVKFNELIISSTVNSNTNTLIDRLVSPITTVEIQLPNRFLTAQSVRVRKFTLSNNDNFALFANGDSYAITQNKLVGIANTMSDEIIPIDFRISRYYGDFDVLSITDNSDNTYTVNINKITYSDVKNVVENSRELQINDKLISSNGLVRYTVLSVDARTNSIKISVEGGYDVLTTGTAKLQYLYTDSNEKRILNIPIKYNERSIVFLSVADDYTQVESVYSDSILLDSSTYTVTVNNTSYTFDEYYQSKVASLGTYLESAVRENNIPSYLGITPDKPSVSSSNFKVVQINKHLTDTAAADKLNKLNKDKATIYNQIQVSNDKIQRYNLQISKGNFKSSEEKSTVEDALSVEISNKNKLSALYASTVTDITTALNSDVPESAPKFRVRGFWEVQSDIISPNTQPQKIIQYAVRYRYVSNTADTSNAQTMSFKTNNGDNVTGVFSSWTETKTEPLIKTVSADGTYAWLPNVIEDVNQQNINQLDISINFGESVEIQVKAISECGYPIAPVMSPWSDIVRIEFPEELLSTTDVQTIARSNSSDLINVAVQNEFKAQGITTHVSTAITEQDKYYAHDAKTIASGFLTAEQKIISLFDKLLSLQSQYDSLQETVNRRITKITAEMIDQYGRVYSVNNFSTVNLFAGYYTDTVDLSNSTNYGTVVEVIFYLKLINRNSNVIEMLSLSPGSTNAITNVSTYQNVPISILGNEVNSEQQLNGQILYIRNNNLSGNIQYFINTGEVSTTTVPIADIDTSAVAANKNVVHKNGTMYETIALKSTALLKDYAVISTAHPAYQEYIAGSTTSIAEEFSRLETFNPTISADTVQNAYSSTRSTEFLLDDKYTIGRNTIGSKLFMRANDITTIQVDGVDTSSSKVIPSGETSAILIPIVFQYRMTDANGFINGDSNLTVNTNFTYTKSIGVDLLVGNDTFKFDINVSSKFRSTTVSNTASTINVLSSISSNGSNTGQIS